MASEKTKIAKCPYCGFRPTLERPTWTTIHPVKKHTKDCVLSKAEYTVSGWNDLCADIELGKLAGEAIRLLGIWRQFRFYIPGEINSEKNPRPELMPETDTFLDLPAIVKIIDEQKGGGG